VQGAQGALGVIVCDDDRFMLETSARLARKCIEENGLAAALVCAATDFKEALRFIEKNPGAYLCFLDIDFGKASLNGVDIAKLIRKAEPRSKVVFVTSHADMAMGVLKSGVEAQAFYRDRISPFASAEIAKSDLYGKLAALGTEQLKAFLFYKISQAIELGIAVELDISQCFSPRAVPIEFTDLVRILGILLDNAIEECAGLENGAIAVKFSQNDEILSYTVKNTASPETRENGVRAGVSAKGGGRGNGLLIVGGILERYDCVTLNSCFQDDFFVQGLVCYIALQSGQRNLNSTI
jgi:CheY-like chemotaxis protein